MKKIYEHTFKKHFGDTVTIYDNSTNYFCVITERDMKSYFIISKDKEYWYPVNSLFKNKDDNIATVLTNASRIKLSKLGKVPLPSYMRKIFSEFDD